jgi:hypothetical protein
MAKVSRSDTVDYVAKLLKTKPDMSYSDVVKEGKKSGYHVYPLIMGLAKNAIGMGRPKRGPGRRRGPGRPRGRGPGRPPKSGRGPGRPASGRTFSADIVRGIERLQSEVGQMRVALREIARLSARF